MTSIEQETTERSIDSLENFLGFLPSASNATPVDIFEASNLSTETFDSRVKESRPCLIRGAIKHWPAVSRWRDSSYWRSCRDEKVQFYTHHNFKTYKFKRLGRIDLSLFDAIDLAFSKKHSVFHMPPYEIASGTMFTEIEKDITGFTFLPKPPKPRGYEKKRFFISRKSATRWHYHGLDETLMCQVSGKKRVILLSPDIPDAKNVDKYLEDEHYLDGKQLKGSARIKAYVAEVGEGDALYIPPYWYHGVFSTDDEVAITLAFCWASPVHVFGNLTNYFVRSTLKMIAWPMNKFSAAVPFFALYAACSLIIRKIIKK